LGVTSGLQATGAQLPCGIVMAKSIEYTWMKDFHHHESFITKLGFDGFDIS
jgi:hypothetical protein